jgi:glycerol-3-phosphate dehydrogenase
MPEYDVVIIGAGVSGTAIARELSRYQVKAAVLEKGEDFCCGTSKANSAIIHAGYDALPGTLMAKLNVQGNEMMDELARDLEIPFRRNGSLVVCTNEEQLPDLQKLYERGITNGVKNLQILTAEEVGEMEPNIADEVCGALYAPTAGIVCPFILNIALGENAYENGVEFWFDTQVHRIKREKDGYQLDTGRGSFYSRYVVNAAGVHADELHHMVSQADMHITPRKGEYFLLDKAAGKHVSRTIFALPSAYGKGVLVAPTIHGNLLVGPTATDIEDKEGVNTTGEGLAQIRSSAGKTVQNLPLNQVITSFAGLRAHEDGHEFIIKEAEDAPGFIDCAGIESPGLSACPAIGKMVAGLLKDALSLEEKPEFKPTRKGIVNPALLTEEERRELIRRKPAYGNIICRCEMITEGEILDAVNRPLGAKSLDGVKRRTRAGMGRCQSGFCSPRVMEIIAREQKKELTEVTKAGGKSGLLVGRNREV